MDPLGDLVGDSPGMEAVRDKVRRLLRQPRDARRLPPVLIQGETGTGKGLLARLIHRASPRAEGPFVDVNCAAIPETLLEAEMFGFERGAFTDARRAKPGLFQAAHRGTIFLDEVGLLSEALQAKLLKVIEERAVRRLGSTRSEPVDVWILTATNEDLRLAVRAQRFREDLYHRLAVLTLALPPLRERDRDLLALAEHFLARACADYGVPPKTFTLEARASLMDYAWPGNIRELGNVMERVALLSPASMVTPEVLALPAPVPPSAREPELEAGASTLDAAMREHLLEVLGRTGWNISRAAAALGISRNTLRSRIEKYGLRSTGSRAAAPRRTARSAPRVTAPATPPPAIVRWEPRRVALLRAALVTPGDVDAPLATSRALEVLVDKVRSFGGRLEGTGPRGLVALFGLESFEDAPDRAAHAAMAMRKALVAAPPGNGPRPGVKIVIHVGQFLVGFGGPSAELDVGAKHEALTALEALTERGAPDSIVVSAAAAPFLARRFELAEVGDAERTPGRAFVLAGRGRTALGPGGRMAEFVGRRHELELLRSRLESAMRGQGQVVGIGGEAGIGKSRLLLEFRRSLDERAVTYVEGQCLSYGSAVPFLPVLDIVRTSLAIAETDTPETATNRVQARLQSLGMEAAVLPYVLQLLGLKDGTDRLALLDPEAVKARTFETLRELILRLNQPGAVVVAVEDLHWIDETSAEFFASLAGAIAGARVLLVSTYRPGYRPPWIERSYATQVALQPLAPEESLTVVHSVLGTQGIADPLVQIVLSKAEGNPFFIEELARAVGASADLLPSVAVPGTIQEVLRARIERLAEREKRLLQSAAVIGSTAPGSLLRAVVGLPDEALRESLLRLEAAEFLYETGVGAEREYAFKHTLTHEVAYQSLREDERRALHARILEATEQVYAERLAEHTEQLAHHAFHGEVWDKALTYLREAGRKAAARSAHREAVACFDQAIVALEHLPESRDIVEQAIDVHLELKTSLTPLAEYGRVIESLRRAEALADATGDERRLGRVSAYVSDYFRLMGEHDRAVESGARALAIARGLADFPLEVTASTYLGLAHYARGDCRRAEEFFKTNVEALVGDLVHERLEMAQLPSVHSRVWLACCLAELGEFVRAARAATEAVRISEAVDHPLSRTIAYFSVGQLHLRKGDLTKAVPALEQSLALSRNWNVGLWFPTIASALGSAYVLGGRVGDALPLLEQAVEREASLGRIGSHSARIQALASGWLAAGRLDAAARLAEQAHDLAREHGERGYEASALCLLGESALRTDPPEEERAEARYREAIALADELGMRPLAARGRLALGLLHRRLGPHSIAEEEITAAGALLREMDMRLWLEQGEAALRELR